MKRTIAAIAAAVVIATLAACGARVRPAAVDRTDTVRVWIVVTAHCDTVAVDSVGR